MKERKNKIKVFIIIAIILLVVMFGITSINQDSSSVNKTVITESLEAEATKHDIIETLTAPGEVKSEKEETLKLNTKYYYSTICAEENEKVKKGANLLKYSNGTYLKAPYDCVVISSDLPDEDEVCTTSNYVEVQSLHTLSMELNISETDINKVSVGDVVDITLTSGGDVVEGNITSISEVGTYYSSGSYFTSKVTFINNGNFKIGMSATCEIVVESAENVVSVPCDAVQTSDSGKYVIVVNDDGTTTNQTVETGISNDDYIEIKSGIEEGTKVQMQSSDDSSSSRSGFDFPGFSGGSSKSSGSSDGQMPTMPDMPGGFGGPQM